MTVHTPGAEQRVASLLFRTRTLHTLLSRLTVGAILALSISEPASAQTLTTCQSLDAHFAVGGGLTINSTYNDLSSGVLGASPTNVLTVDTGPGFVANAVLLPHAPFGVAVSYGRSALGIDRRLFPGTPNEDSVSVGEHLVVSELMFGFVNHFTPNARRVCGYAGVSVGTYHLAAAFIASRRGGLAGTFGVNVPFTATAAIFAEVQLKAIGNSYRPPVSASLIVVATASVGLRYSFR